MTTIDTAASRAERKDLRELAKALNDQLKQLTYTVGEVRHSLLAEAREIRKEYRAARRPPARRSIDPITVFHANGKCSTAKGHDCTEPPSQAKPTRSARVTSVDGSEKRAKGTVVAPKVPCRGAKTEPGTATVGTPQGDPSNA